MSIPGNTDQMWQILGDKPSLTTLSDHPDYAGGYRVYYNPRGNTRVAFRDAKGWHEHEICGVTDAKQVTAYRVKKGQYTLVLIRNIPANYANLYVFQGSGRLSAISAQGMDAFQDITGNWGALRNWSGLKLAKEMVGNATLGGDDVCRLDSEGGACP